MKLNNFTIGHYQWAVITTILFIAILFLVNALFGPLIYTNDTASAPRGIYVVSPNQHLSNGDYVIVPAPMAVPAIHIQKDFPLLKRIAAFQGDTYTVKHDFLETDRNGNTYPIYHKPWLPQLSQGQYSVPEGQILCLNDPLYSLDSRYFGPLPLASVRKKVVLLINYDAIDQFLYRLL